MADPIRAILRRLQGAFGRAPAAGAPDPATGSVYRTPAAREEETESTAPAITAEESQLIELIRALREPPMPFVRGTPQVVRLDPPGLLDRWSILGVRQWFWQYQCHSIIAFEREGERHVYSLPEIRSVESDSISRLPARRIDGASLAPGEIDFAPMIRRDLHRAIDAGHHHLLGDAIAILHVLARATGIGSEELNLPRVVVGDAADDLLDARLGAGSASDVRRAIREGSLADKPATGARRFAALLDRHVKTDGEVGGYHADLSLGQIKLSEDEWTYSWEILWAESEEGIPTS